MKIQDKRMQQDFNQAMAIAHAIKGTDKAKEAVDDLAESIYPWLEKKRQGEKERMKQHMEEEAGKVYKIRAI